MNLKPFRVFCLAAAIVAAPSPSSAAPLRPLTEGERAVRLSLVVDGLNKALYNLDVQTNAVPLSVPERSLTWAAMAKLSLSRDPAAAESLLRIAFEQQVSDPTRPDYGNVPWQIGHPEIKDANAIEFTMQAVGPILLQNGDKLSPAFQTWLRPHLVAGIVAVEHHTVSVRYTNIFLMKLTNLILLGEAAGDRKAVAKGTQMFDEWLAYTRANGISEYLSPTYYATDLNSLLLGYRFASDLAVRDRYEKTLNLFVSDIAADLFVSGGLLGGPHSRDYDFLLGNGSLAVYLYAEGFIEHLNPKSVDLENACILTGLTGAAYHPGEPIYRIANTPERMVVGRCGPMGIGDRYTYVTSDFTLGSAGADYGEQDKLINLMFSSDHPLPAITVVPDIFDAPYGKIMTKDRSGHGKPTHLPLHPALVQDRGTLLAFLDIDPSASKQPSGTLATNIVLPSHVDEIDIDGAPVKVDAPFALPVTLNSVVSLRLGNAFVGIRIFEATGAEGQAASIALVGDIEGMKRGAIRLAVNQYRGAARQFASRHAPVGFLMIARHIATPADATTALTELREATITVNADAHTAHVEAKVGGEAMSVDRNFDTGQTSNKSIAGKPVTFPIVSVNGQDLIASTINP